MSRENKELLVEMGCEIEEYDDAIRVRSNTKLTHTNIKTLPYPGFPTDMQPQMAVILSCAEGTSIVKVYGRTVLSMLMNCREWVQPSRLREIRRLLQDANVLRELRWPHRISEPEQHLL